MRIATLIVVIAIAITGCQKEPLTKTANSVSFEYNRALEKPWGVVAEANAHCAKHGKQAELRSRTISPGGNVYTDIFDCR